MLVERGFIDNAQVIPIAGGDARVKFLGKPVLTIERLEFLHENSLMQKAAKAAKGILNAGTNLL